ncbi:hypothetical protein Misp01_66910 [Microtetraspora sp. NBRC 13810]|nr:hypothetical protein Misp01_66910 [Microtetraspora sp. NBRC 13810]
MQVALGEGNRTRFQCGYHRWAYDLSGALVHAPEMPELRDGGIRLPEVRTAVWQGIVFVNLRQDAPDLHEQLSELSSILEPWNAGSLEPVYERPYPCAWNWKIMYENGIESYHILGTHRASLEDPLPTRVSYGAPGDGRNYAEIHLPFAPAADGLFAADAVVPALPGLPSWAAEKFVFWAVHPNLIMNQTLDGLQTYITLPHGPQESTFTWAYMTHQEAKASPNYARFKKAQEDFADLVQGEDAMCTRPVQESMNSGDYVPGPYNQRELPVWAFHRWYVHRMAGGAEEAATW